MRVTYRDAESEVTIEPVVTGPKVVLYDHEGSPLKRAIGFTYHPQLDNHSRNKTK